MAIHAGGRTLEVHGLSIWQAGPSNGPEVQKAIATVIATAHALSLVCRLWHDLIQFPYARIHWTDASRPPTRLFDLLKVNEARGSSASPLTPAQELRAAQVQRLDVHIAVPAESMRVACFKFWNAVAVFVGFCHNLKVLNVSGKFSYAPVELLDVVCSRLHGTGLVALTIQSDLSISPDPNTLLRILRGKRSLKSFHISGTAKGGIFEPHHVLPLRLQPPHPIRLENITSYSYLPAHEGVTLRSLKELSVESQWAARLLNDEYFLRMAAPQIISLHLVVRTHPAERFFSATSILELFPAVEKFSIAFTSTVDSGPFFVDLQLPATVYALGIRSAVASVDPAEAHWSLISPPDITLLVTDDVDFRQKLFEFVERCGSLEVLRFLSLEETASLRCPTGRLLSWLRRLALCVVRLEGCDGLSLL